MSASPTQFRECGGGLLEADADALVNAVNVVGVAGKGLAYQFRQAFPANFEAYQAACQSGQVRVGEMFVHNNGLLRPHWIINFPTKNHWRHPSSVPYVRAGLDALRDVITELSITSIAVPALGCGLGGLE